MKDLLKKYADCDAFSMTKPLDYDENVLKNARLAISENSFSYLSRRVGKSPEECFKEFLSVKERLSAALQDYFNGDYVLWEKEKCETDGNRLWYYSPETNDLAGFQTEKGESKEITAYAFSVLKNEYVLPSIYRYSLLPLVKETDLWGVYEELKSFCVKVEFTDKWSLSSQPGSKHRHYTFLLTSETKKWLAEHEEDIERDNALLQDLCFYRQGKMRYASITHEGYDREFRL